jgi:hypothetical protein
MIFEQPEDILRKLENLLNMIVNLQVRGDIEEDDIKRLGEDLPIIKSLEFLDKFKNLGLSINTFNEVIQTNIKKRAENPKKKPNIKQSKKYSANLSNRIMSSLPEFIATFKKGMSNYDAELAKHEQDIQLSRESAPNIRSVPTIAFYIHCHGQSLLTCDNKSQLVFELFKPEIEIFKFTAAPICMTFGSTEIQDKTIAVIFVILDKWHKETYGGESIFSNINMSIMLANYLICKFYKEYNCNIFRHICPDERPKNPTGKFLDAQFIIDMFHRAINSAILASNGLLYTHPISNAAIYRRLSFDDSNAEEDLLRRMTTTSTRKSEPYHPSRVTITVPGTAKDEHRNKVFAVEDTTVDKNAVSLDIKILTSFSFSFPGDSRVGDSRVINVGAGESLLKLLLDWYSLIPDSDPPQYSDGMGPYATYLTEIIRLYDEKYRGENPPSVEADIGGSGRRAHDFDKSSAYRSSRRGLYTTITSISFRFLSFFLCKIGARHASIFDFSCGFLDYDKDGDERSEEVVCEIQSRHVATQLSQSSSPSSISQSSSPSSISQSSSQSLSLGQSPLVLDALEQSEAKRVARQQTRRNKQITVEEEESEEKDMTQEAGKRIMTASIKRKKNVTRSRRRIHRTRRRRNTKTKKYYLRKTRHTLKKKNKSKSMRRRNK